MKLRIKSNSIRIRLTRIEVNTLAATGYLEEQTLFANNKFVYALQSVDDADALSAAMNGNTITMFVPNKLIKYWPVNDVVGFEARIPVA